MTASRIILLRHGQTDYNLNQRVQGGVDIPLNELGLTQARCAAGELSAYLEGLRVGRLVSSPLSRALVTAEIIAAALGVAVVPDDRLVERRFGLWEGLTRPEMVERWPEKYAEWGRGGTPEGVGMESREDVRVRVDAAIREHSEALGDDEILVVVGHGSANNIGLMSMLGLGLESGWPLRGLDNCHWSDVSRQERRWPAWALRAHNVGRAGDPAVAVVTRP